MSLALTTKLSTFQRFEFQDTLVGRVSKTLSCITFHHKLSNDERGMIFFGPPTPNSQYQRIHHIKEKMQQISYQMTQLTLNTLGKLVLGTCKFNYGSNAITLSAKCSYWNLRVHSGSQGQICIVGTHVYCYHVKVTIGTSVSFVGLCAKL